MRHDALDPPGATVRRYRIERLIGTGGAAAVYEARRLGPKGPGERVACKVMLADRQDAPRYRALVWHEAVVGLRHTPGHPNLVEVLDFFDDAREQLCIVMELVDGASAEHLRDHDAPIFAITMRRNPHCPGFESLTDFRQPFCWNVWTLGGLQLYQSLQGIGSEMHSR